MSWCNPVCPHRVAHAICSVVLLAFPASTVAQIPTPEAHFGFQMGTDRELASIIEIEQYFELVAAGSDRIVITDIGTTTQGGRTIAAIISAPQNIDTLPNQSDNRRLADPRTIEPDEASRLAKSHKAVLVIRAAIHSSEIGATQAANELLHQLATSSEPDTLRVLEDLIIILIPSLNPDGHRLVVDWYERQKGTPFEGGPMPWLYHEYAGHDLNRDAFMMNLAENRNLSRFFYSEWHPQVFLTMHQMGTTGPRFFVPPNSDPVDQNYDPLIWRTAALLGGAMALELQRDGLAGVVSNALYDYYWPGYEDSAPLGHNTVCLLAEVAGVKIATPITVPAEELQGGHRGLAEYRPQINFPDPWPGGPWTLRDIVEYDLSAVNGLLYAVSAYRGQIVENFYSMGRRAVTAGEGGGPFAFIIPPDQHDPHAAARFQDLLIDGGIEIHRALEPFRADGDPYPEGTDIILLAQPFRAYVKTLLERQEYPPDRATPDGSRQRPYDATGWTLPAQMGVDVRTIERYFQVPAMTRRASASIAHANVWGDTRPNFYVIDGRGNGGAIAINRLVETGAMPEWLTSPLVLGGYQYPSGSIVVRHSREVESVIADIATDLGLRVDGARGRSPSNIQPVGGARIGLYKPWVANIDEVWTRWLFDEYEFPFTSLSNRDVQEGDLRARFDAIVIPNATPSSLEDGYEDGAVPDEYAGGLGERGLATLRAFVEDGGTLVCLDESCGLPIERWRLPIRDVTVEASDDFFCPGSLLRVDLDVAQPLAYGMSESIAGFFAFSSAYVTNDPDHSATVARYGTSDLLISGWLEGGEAISGQSAVVELELGEGRVVLLGFRVQHRGQSHAAFRLLFNPLLTATKGR